MLSYSQSGVSVKPGKLIEAYDEKITYFNLYAPDDLSVNKALAQRCPGGEISGVETALVKRELIIAQIYELRAKASCQSSAEMISEPKR